MADLNERQLQFCREYIIDFNGTAAAKRAGYSAKTANPTAARLLVNVSIQDEIRRLTAERSEKTGITAERVVHQLAKIAFSDVKQTLEWSTVEFNNEIGVDPITKQKVFAKVPITRVSLKDMDQVDGTLIQSVKMTKHGVAVEMVDKMKAMEMLAKHLGVYDERPQQTVNIEGYKKALWERANAGELWDGFNNGGPDPGENDGED